MSYKIVEIGREEKQFSPGAQLHVRTDLGPLPVKEPAPQLLVVTVQVGGPAGIVKGFFRIHGGVPWKSCLCDTWMVLTPVQPQISSITKRPMTDGEGRALFTDAGPAVWLNTRYIVSVEPLENGPTVEQVIAP